MEPLSPSAASSITRRPGARRCNAGWWVATEATTSGTDACEAAEDLGEGEVGERAVGEVEAVAGDDLPAVVDGEVAQLDEQAGLADAGVTREEDGRTGAAGGGAGVPGRDDAEPESEVLQLGVSPDQGGGRHGRHAAHHVG